jgi:hypothetical protein
MKKKIEDLKDWDILTYLRLQRNWMVLSHYSREDIERDFGHKFADDEEWADFTAFACNIFDNVKHDLMINMIRLFEKTSKDELNHEMSNELNIKNVCICGLKLKPFQYEPLCTEDGETFRRWSCSCGFVGEEHYNEDMEFIGMFNYYKPKQFENDCCEDAEDFFKPNSND